MTRTSRLPLLAALLCAALLAAAAPAGAATHPVRKARWLGGVTVTEYYPVPEAWFVGRKVAAPGLDGLHRIDWLYSAQGISMQGTGIGLDGQLYHIDQLGSGGWITERARPSVPGRDGWSAPPYWRAGGYWLARGHHVTFPLEAGGWSNGKGRRYVPLPDVSFVAGASKPLRYYRSIAVDPRLIPLGSLVYIDAYRDTPGHGWFRAEDVGGAIIGRHVDVYRPPPVTRAAGASRYDALRIYVIPPGQAPGADAPPRVPPPPPPPPTTDPTPTQGGGAGATASGAGSPTGGASAP